MSSCLDRDGVGFSFSLRQRSNLAFFFQSRDGCQLASVSALEKKRPTAKCELLPALATFYPRSTNPDELVPALPQTVLGGSAPRLQPRVYALGASPELAPSEVVACSSKPEPNKATEDFAEHLGDEVYMSLHGFSICPINRPKVLRRLPRLLYGLPTAETLERVIFSPAYNFVSDHKTTEGDSGKHPQMLNRLPGGLVHPSIHVLYGFEFGIHGSIAEGIC